MASPARPAASSFGLAPDAAAAAARCSFDFDQTRRREDLQDKRLARSFVSVYEQESYSKEIIMTAVEDCMKKQADSLLHSLEGINGRLSQLELYCYKLERSIGELRSDVMDYHSEGNFNFRRLEKHLDEVQKSVQILQDKQEVAETQKELTKLKIAHNDSAQKNEATTSMLLAKENDDSIQVAKREIALMPLHQVNAMQSPAMQFRSCSGLVLQQLMPVSLSTQHDQQHLNQATVYYMKSQGNVEHAEAPPVQPAAQAVHTHIQNPQSRVLSELPQQTSHALESYPQHQQQRPQLPARLVQSQLPQSQQKVVQQQPYNVQPVPPQIVQLQTSSPQAESTPQVTLLYPPYCSHQPASATNEPVSRSIVVQAPYTTISSSQQKHQEFISPVYGQGNTILLPLAEHNIQHQQPLSQASCAPQLSKLGRCSLATYPLQGSVQTYSTSHQNPSKSSATVFAVLPQQTPDSTPKVLHPLGLQAVQNYPFGGMVEKATPMGYPRDQVESMTLPMMTAAHPVDSNTMVDRFNAGSSVATPREWSG